MEVIEDGNIMDRVPILLQRDFEYYQSNQTVLSETVCRGVVGGRLDFPRNASFASVKIVLWLEEEFSIAFSRGSGMFVTSEEDDNSEPGVVKTSDPDKFVQLTTKASDMLLEHLHVLAQEALDHADLPVLTATLGAAALVKNSLHCYVQALEDLGTSEQHGLLLSWYKRFVTMSEAVGERVLDLHNRVLSLYILQDWGGRSIDGNCTSTASGSPSVQGWWLYMQGTRKDLWDTVPPRMAQRIFAGMLNETLTILTVRYCQTTTSQSIVPLIINDILNILLCTAELLPSICTSGSDLAGLNVKQLTRDVRDVHAKCNELFKCMVYRGADIHFIHQAFKAPNEVMTENRDYPFPWFVFVSPNLFEGSLDDIKARSSDELSDKTAIGLELKVLLAQPQPSWALLVKVLMMRNCKLIRMLLVHAIRHMSTDNAKWSADGRWHGSGKCGGILCTADGYCNFKGDSKVGDALSRLSGALTYVLGTIGSESELQSTFIYAQEISGRDWAACLDKRQVWCDSRPAWLAAVLALAGSALRFIPPVLVKAVQTGASMYQAMSLTIACISRSLPAISQEIIQVGATIQRALPTHIRPVGGSVVLQLIITLLYEELLNWANREAFKEKKDEFKINGEVREPTRKPAKKQVRIRSVENNSYSFDGSQSNPSSIAIAVAEALCSIDEQDKHTDELAQLMDQFNTSCTLSNQYGLEDLPDFARLVEKCKIGASNAERASDSAALNSEILMTTAGKDSLRVIYNHLQCDSERIYKELGITETDDASDNITLSDAPLIYIMFHIGKRPFDQYLRNEWAMPWSSLVRSAKRSSGGGGEGGARGHVLRRPDFADFKAHAHNADNKALKDLYEIFKSRSSQVL